MDGNDVLTKLANGACTTKEQTPVQAVIVQSQPQEVACSTGPTKAILLDSNKIGSEACVEADFPLSNTTDETQILRFGAFGRSGDYQLLNEDPIAVDAAGVISTDYGAAGNNAMGIQRFNYLVELTGIVIAYMRVRGIDTTTQQTNQRATFRTWSYNKDTKCQKSFISPACDSCPNNSNQTDNGVRTFAKVLPLDGLHSLDYPMLTDSELTIEIGMIGIDSAKNYVPCDSNANLY